MPSVHALDAGRGAWSLKPSRGSWSSSIKSSYIMAQDSILTGPGNRAPRPTPERHRSRSPGATHRRPHPASERNDMNIVGALESPDLLL